MSMSRAFCNLHKTLNNIPFMSKKVENIYRLIPKEVSLWGEEDR